MIDESAEALTSWPSMVRVNKFSLMVVSCGNEIGGIGCVYFYYKFFRVAYIFQKTSYKSMSNCLLLVYQNLDFLMMAES